MSERVEILTKDGIKIMGDYYPVSGFFSSAALLLHMMPADRKSWASFAEKLQKAGIPALAIDLRGHGESTETAKGQKIDYRNFSDKEHQESIEDVRVAHRWLKEKGAERVFVAGASIGANLALKHASQNSDARAVILLSPGINYRGIKALPLAKSIDSGKEVFIVAARDDGNVDGADKMAKEIHEAINSVKNIKIFEMGGHGTDILKAHPDFENDLVDFFKKHL